MRESAGGPLPSTDTRTDGNKPFTVQEVTINVCTVDRPDMLIAALRSLKITTDAGTPLQVIFNGSPSSTVERATRELADWHGTVVFDRFPSVVPLEVSHNRGLELAQSPLINFMGDDDLVLAPRLKKLVDVFNTVRPMPAVVTSFARRIVGDAFEPTITSAKTLGPTTVEEWRERRDRGEVFEMLWPGAVIRTDLLREMGGFEAAFNCSADNRIFTVLAQDSPVLSIPDLTFGYRIHSGSISTSSWRKQNHHVRYVEACLAATRRGEPEPLPEEFAAMEAARPWKVRRRQDLVDRSRTHFRRGGEQLVEGRRVRGAANLAASLAIHPRAFVRKVRDQGKPDDDPRPIRASMGLG